MKPHILLVLGIFFAVVISGCTELGNISTVSSKDLILYPQRYSNQNVTVRVSPQSSAWIIGAYSSWPDFKYTIDSKDEEGKPVYLFVKYGNFYCNNCEITGSVKTVSGCECQEDTCIGGKDYCKSLYIPQWKGPYYYVLSGLMSIKACEKEPREIEIGVHYERTIWRCKPDTTKDVYYFDVTKVKSLD